MKTRKNNKGFSLVELIVVVAIMAVLVGVLAPAYLKYVEKSRKSTDISAVDNIMQTMNVCASDITLKLKDNDTMSATCSGGTVTFAASTTEAEGELASMLGTVKCKSAFDDWKLEGTVDENGAVTFTLTGTDAGDMKTYSEALGEKVS